MVKDFNGDKAPRPYGFAWFFHTCWGSIKTNLLEVF